MDLVLSDDQQGLQQELRRFLASGAVRLDADRLDRDLWRQLGDMGVFALTLPEADGGLGLGLADAVVVFEELGRAAVPGPLVSTALAVGWSRGPSPAPWSSAWCRPRSRPSSSTATTSTCCW